MGYLTTITIYNDGLDLLDKEDEALDFIKKLRQSTCYSNPVFYLHANDIINVGNFTNFCTVQKPRHSSEDTVYVQTCNTIVEINPWESIGHRPNTPGPGDTCGKLDKKGEVLYRTNKVFFEKIVKILSDRLKEMVGFMKDEDLKNSIMSDSGIVPNKRLSDSIHQELLLESFRNKENKTLKDYIKLYN